MSSKELQVLAAAWIEDEEEVRRRSTQQIGENWINWILFAYNVHTLFSHALYFFWAIPMLYILSFF